MSDDLGIGDETAIVVPSDRPSLTSATPTLTVVAGPGLGRHVALGDRTIHIGRLPACELVIESSSVSRRHARIELRMAGHCIVDLGSKNGTRVNGATVRESPLADGDVVKLGKAVLKYAESIGTEVRYLRELYESSGTDALTSLANRRRFDETLRIEANKAIATGALLVLLMVDIDHFKAVNDRYGHLAGDRVLKTVAQVLREQVRESDLVGRVGGEEFAILCAGIDPEGALRLAERVRAAVEETGIEYEGRSLQVTVSVGVAAQRADEEWNTQTLYKDADDRLYSAKRSGRNRVSGCG
jgi:diguanylate cyclase (GGDEF)-like protein